MPTTRTAPAKSTTVKAAVKAALTLPVTAKPATPKPATPKPATAKPATPKAATPKAAAPKAAAAAKPASSPATKPAARPAKGAKLRQKPVRDSFTMPEADFSLIATLKARALAGKRETKKSELLRAGLHALAAMDSATLLAALVALEPIKTGRPRKGH